MLPNRFCKFRLKTLYQKLTITNLDSCLNATASASKEKTPPRQLCEEVASMLGHRGQLMAAVCTDFPLPFELQSFVLTSSGVNLKGYHSCLSWFYCCRCAVQKQPHVTASMHNCLSSSDMWPPGLNKFWVCLRALGYLEHFWSACFAPCPRMVHFGVEVLIVISLKRTKYRKAGHLHSGRKHETCTFSRMLLIFIK